MSESGDNGHSAVSDGDTQSLSGQQPEDAGYESSTRTESEADAVYGLHSSREPEGVADDETVKNVVLIHGVSDPDWNTRRKIWPRWAWVKHLELDPTQLLQYCYKFDDYGDNSLGRDWLESAALGLLDGLVRFKNKETMRNASLRTSASKNSFQEKPARPFIFICLDVGGIIVKKALTIASLDPARYQNIDFLTTGLVFINCPHRSYGLEGLEDQLTRLLLLKPSCFYTNVIQKAQYLAKRAQDVNNNFLESKTLIRAFIFNIISPSTKQARESIKNVEDIESDDSDSDNSDSEYENKQKSFTKPACREDLDATLPGYLGSIGAPFEFSYATVYSHQELVIPGNSDGDELSLDTEFLASLRRTMETVKNALRTTRPPSFDGIANYHRAVLSQVPSIIPNNQTQPDRVLSSLAARWVLDRQPYKALYNAGVSILHIHGTSKVTTVSRSLHERLTNSWNESNLDRQNTLYFEFVRTDSRYNNVQAMLTSFIGQVISRISPMHPDINIDFEVGMLPHCAYRSWSMGDIFRTFRRAISALVVFNTVIVISRLDQCDETRFWLMDQLDSISFLDDQSWNIIITSQDDGQVADYLSKYPRINLDDCPALKKSNSDDADSSYRKELHTVLMERPDLAVHKERLWDLLRQCHEDIQLARWLVDCLRRTHQVTGRSFSEATTDTRDMLKVLSPLSPVSALRVMVEYSGPHARRAWMEGVLGFLKYTVRPITRHEFAFLLALLDSKNPTKLNEVEVEATTHMLLQAFGSFITFQGNEIRLQERLIEQTTPSKAEAVAIHSQIASHCLRYLGFEEVQEQIHRFCNCYDAVVETASSAPRTNLISYAAMYWPTHYKLAGSEAPLEQARKFFRNPRARNAWTAASYTLSNPFTRTMRSYLSPLGAVAMTGLDDVLANIITDEKQSLQSDVFTENCGSALSEAARFGHVGTLHLLMEAAPDAGGLANYHLKDAITAAASSDRADTLEALIKHAYTIKGFEWPPNLIHQVAWRGLGGAAKLLVDSGIDVSAPETVKLRGYTPIHHAGASRDVETVKAFLRARPAPDLNVENDYNSSPLHTVALHGDPEIAGLLVDAGAPVDGVGPTAIPLQLAVIWGKPHFLETLLKRKPKMYPYNESYVSDSFWRSHPLIIAAYEGHTRCVQLLLRHGVNITAKRTQATALWYAVTGTSCNKLEIVRLLLEAGADPNESPPDMDTVLIAAVSRKHVDIVDLLLDSGARVNVENPTETWRSTPLSRAAGTGNEELVRLLIDKGKATVNYTGKDSQSPLYVAAFSRDISIAKVLLTHHADVNAAMTGPGWSPLHASYDSPEIAKLFLEAGAEINRQCIQGTVLCLAARFGFSDVVEVVLSHVANPPDLEIELDYPDANPDDVGMTALSAACEKPNLRGMRLLLEAGADPNHHGHFGSSSPLKICMTNALLGQEKAVKLLLEYAPDVKHRDKDGNTPLHYITATTKLSIVRLLVNAGADVNTLNAAGESPLYKALSEGKPSTIKYLLSKKANPHLMSQRFDSLLHVACQRTFATVRMLVESGADPVIADTAYPEREGLITTALSRAILPLPTVQYLVEKCGLDVNRKGGRFSYAIHTACREGKAEVVRYLGQEKGANPNLVESAGRSALHLATIYRGTLEALLELDIDKFNDGKPIRDKMGRTPLHFAAGGGIAANVSDLRDIYPDAVAMPDGEGWTPLFWAVHSKAQDRAVIESLVPHGKGIWAKAKGPDGDQWSPLKLARYLGAHDEILELLQPNPGTKGPNGEIWDDQEHLSKEAFDHQRWTCDSCIVKIRGSVWNCVECNNFDFCYRCYMSRDAMHPNHSFERIASEFAEEESNSQEPGDITPLPHHEDSSVDSSDDGDDLAKLIANDLEGESADDEEEGLEVELDEAEDDNESVTQRASDP